MRPLLHALVISAAVLLAIGSPAVGAGLPDRPLTLEECIALACQHNPSLVIAQQQVVSAGAGVGKALSSYYPSASFIATQGRTAGSSFVETPGGTVAFTATGRRREAEVVLSQTVWQTARGDSVSQARHSFGAALADQQATGQDLVLSVSQLYYSALAAEQLVEVAEANLAAARDHEKLAKARAEVGAAPPVDVVPAEADVADAEFSLLQAQNNADVAKAQLKREIGLPPTYRVQLSRPGIQDLDQPRPSLDEALGTARARRPEVTAMRASVAAAEDSLRIARAMRGPLFTLSAQYDRGLQGPQEGTSWAAMLSADVPLFDAGARTSEVISARAALRSQQAQEQQLANSIGTEVETALLNVDTARQSVRAAEKAVTSAQAQLAAAEGKYKGGVGIFVEILDAQKAVARARTNHVQAIYDYQSALVSLRRATGELTLPAPGEQALHTAGPSGPRGVLSGSPRGGQAP